MAAALAGLQFALMAIIKGSLLTYRHDTVKRKLSSPLCQQLGNSKACPQLPQ